MYAKIFSSLFQGTLRGNSHGILVFTNLLAHCDAAGIVDMHPRAISDEVGLTVDEVRAALSMLEQPDKDSRSPEEEGRRIVRLDDHRDWGWLVVNYGKYRAIRSADDRREQNRLAQQRFRENHADSNNSKQNKPKEKEKQKQLNTLSGKPDDASLILEFLNEKAGRAYRPTPVNLGLIKARLKEGYTPAQCRQVVAKKCREWGADDKMAMYLRPATLFNREKFNQYAGELVIPKEPNNA